MIRARVSAALGLVAVLAVGLFAPSPATATATASVQAAAVSTGVSSAAAAASAGGWRPTQGAFFNQPRTYDQRQWNIARRIIAAIDHARPRTVIRMAMYSFDRVPVADALIRAHRRGVKIQVIANAHEYPAAQRKLARVIGTNPKKHQFIYHCVRGNRAGVEGSCRGGGDVQHIKFILFERTGAARNVVMLGSLNMKMNGNLNQYNDWWIKNQAPAVHDFFVDLFKQMREDRARKSPYISKKLSDKFQAQVYPYFGPMSGDPVLKALQPVRCTGATNTGDGRTEIRVNMHAWDGDRGQIIAKRLRALKNAGCDVAVQYGMAGRTVRQILANPTRFGRIPARSSGYDTDGDGEIDLYSHQKLLMVKGNYGAKRNQTITWTGSVNYQDSGKYGDELFFRIISPSNHKQYMRNWTWMWHHKTRTLGVATARTMVGGRMVARPVYVDPLSDASLPQAAKQG